MATSEPSPGTMPNLSSSANSAGANDVHDIVKVRVRGLAKTPVAVRDALDPARRQQFEAEYRAALARAANTLDLEPVLTLVQRTWWVRAVMSLNPDMIDGVAADMERVAVGEQSIFADEDR